MDYDTIFTGYDGFERHCLQGSFFFFPLPHLPIWRIMHRRGQSVPRGTKRLRRIGYRVQRIAPDGTAGVTTTEWHFRLVTASRENTPVVRAREGNKAAATHSLRKEPCGKESLTTAQLSKSPGSPRQAFDQPTVGEVQGLPHLSILGRYAWI